MIFAAKKDGEHPNKFHIFNYVEPHNGLPNCQMAQSRQHFVMQRSAIG
jgi:hypothetical protein